MPATLSEANWITFEGTTSVAESRTIDSVDVLTDAGGIALTIDGAALSNDEVRGQLIQWTSGAANGDFGWIYRNTANQIFVTNEDNSAIPAIVATDTIDFIDLDTSLEYTGTPVIENSSQLNIRKVNMTDDVANGRVLFILSTDKIEIRYTNWTMGRPQVGGYGRAHFWCNYIGTKGATNRGCLAGVNGSFIQLERGTVIDCGLNTSAANKRFIQFAAGANVSFSGQTVIRQIDDARGIECDGMVWLAGGGIGTHDTWRFETEGATASNIAGFIFNTTGEGIGGVSQLPNIQGEVTSNFVVEAQLNAYITFGTSSSVTTNTTTNAVSADGGTSASAEARDGTKIEGADPGVKEFHAVQTLAASGDIDGSWPRVDVAGSGGAVTLTSTPNIIAGSDGEELIIKGTSNTNTLTIQDESQLGSSGVFTKTGTNVTLTQGDVFKCIYSSTDSAWIEL
jgi:hypothetical protein